ncbi:ATP-dependent translocase ABCB1 [Neodiprion lecontei]|uniref:ABC-type xenobiotic transporter n=1 Tax=Neodiprion lecontei TaxID=441921 RepID=A0A6J0CDQ4_NEOLC|nr:ATP-dependent translocase ABCB1 [Neodiprion lecontei]
MKNVKKLELAMVAQDPSTISSKANPIEILGFRPTDEESKETENHKSAEKPKPPEYPAISFWKLFKYSDGCEKFFLVIGAISAVVTGFCQPANIYIYGDLIGSMVQAALLEDYTQLMDSVVLFAILNSVIGIIMLSFSYISIMLYNIAGQRQIYRIRNMYLESALHQDISWYDLTPSGDVASRLAEDITKLEEGISEKTVMFIHNMSAFVGCVIVAFTKGWKLALVCMVSLPVTVLVIGAVVSITSRLARKEIEAYAKAGSIAEEVLSAMRTVVAFGGQKLELTRYTENLIYAYKNNTKRAMFSGFGFGMLWFFIYSSYALSFWYGVGLIIEERNLDTSEQTYDAATMITVFLAVMMGSMNFGTASPFIEAFGIAKAAGAKVFAVIERKSSIDSLSNDGVKPKNTNGAIEFKNVVFNYPSRPDIEVLGGLNLTINPGETVALVGGSGCGKSTCIQLLQRFYDPPGGQILLDGQDLKDLNVEWLRSNIGIVGQEPVLFDTTIAENIRYGKINATEEEIVAAAKKANAHDFITKLHKGYDTLVGERGAQISGGQKQRIAIARALVRNPRILLLDEATSALDTRSEAKVQAALDRASEGRTTIIVAHRLSTIRDANKIIVLAKGIAVEQGSHDDLMKLKQHYYGLVTSQISELEESGRKDQTRSDEIEEDEDNEKVIMNRQNTLYEEVTETSAVSMLNVLKYNEPEKYYIILACLTSAIVGCSTPLFAILFGDLIGILSYPDVDQVRSETNMYCLYFVLIGILVGSATFIQIFVFGIAGERLTMRMRELAFGTMLKQEMAWFDVPSNGTGSLCAKLSGEAAAIQGATGQRIGTLIQSATTIVLGLALAMYYEWRLGLVGTAFIPFILVTIYLQGLIMHKESFDYHKSLEQSTKIAVEAVSNIRTVAGLGREETFQIAYADAMRPSFELGKKNTHVRAIVFALARSILYFAYAVVMWYGGTLITNEGLNYAVVFKVAQALIMGTVMVANALAFAPNYQKGLIAAGKIFALINRKPAIVDPKNPNEEKWNITGEVNYNSVTFEYPTRPGIVILKALNLEIPSGKTIALIGSSGCGKSTTIQLLERFYDPNIGSVELDNKDISSVTLDSLRSHLGIVSQEPSLFARTIAENIAYGDNSRNVLMSDIEAAAKKANIHTFITSLPLGYDTKLGDKGTQISGGQKQRIAIARALVRNPKVLLLDEATSALDMESEKIVQAALDEAKEGRTCITIAHRLSTIQDADKICVLDRGVVAESGTHAELVAKKGLYYKLRTLQS